MSEKVKDERDYQNIYEAKGLKNVNLAALEKNNLIIGKNGSGKTRFLKALEQDKEQNREDGTEVITLYFPEIQAFYEHARESEMQETEVDPYDLLQGSEGMDFKDFLKIMEKDKGQIFMAILQSAQIRGARKNREKALHALELLNGFLMDYFQKKMEISDDRSLMKIVQYDENNKVLRELAYEDALGEFSPGELMIFYLCVFLGVLKARNGRKLVLLMDEPEIHLHPRALVKFIKMLKDMDEIAELWIASHSLFLVPFFKFEEVVFLDRGTVVKKHSQFYKELYKDLVGLENENLFEFLKSIHDWEYYQFIAECFSLPEPVSQVSVKDEQFRKLMEAIQHIKNKKTIRILDYGAGQCRIGECIRLLASSGEIMSNVEYHAYEPYPENEAELRKKGFKLYTKYGQMVQELEFCYDVIVLMNVLHEVPVKEWQGTFQKIVKVLGQGGILVLLEVQALTSGEQPYGENGYLVLQDEQVKILFNNDQILGINVASKEKSNCWIVPRDSLLSVSADSIKSAIGSLYRRSNRELEECYLRRIKMAHTRASEQDCYMAARKYAFLSQQCINAQFALKELGAGSEEWLKGTVKDKAVKLDLTPLPKIKVKNVSPSD